MICNVSLRKIRFIQPHVLFTGVYLLKRLFVGFGVSRRASPFGAAPVQVFLASSPCAASATSYHFSSIAPPPWRCAFSRFALVVNLGLPVLASGSNRAVKPTRLRRAAYFRSLAPKKTNLFSPCLFKRHSVFQALFSAWFAASPGFACWRSIVFQHFWHLVIFQ